MSQMGIEQDHEYGIMDYHKGVLSLLPDDRKMQVAMRKWTTADMASGGSDWQLCD